MLKCPVCKTDNLHAGKCSTCGFDLQSSDFLSESDGKKWFEETVLPYRATYLESLNDFVIVGNTLIEYRGHQSVVTVPFGVEVIGESVFSGFSNISIVILPNTVRIIAKKAFECSSVVSVVLSENLTHISSYSFNLCKKLQSIFIPPSCKIISRSAFESCSSLETVELADGVEIICENAFANCDKVAAFDLPSSIKHLGGGWCSGCSNAKFSINKCNGRFSMFGLYTIIDKENGTVVSGDLLDGLPQMDWVWRIGDSAYACSGNRERENNGITNPDLVIPGNIREIGENAFLNDPFDNILISAGVERIGAYAFGLCMGVEHISIPSSVFYIGEGAFSVDSPFSEIEVNEENPRFIVDRNCLIDIAEGTIIAGSLDDGIPSRNDVSNIGESAFFAKTADHLRIPRNIRTIQEEAFYDCSFETVIIPSTVRYIASRSLSCDAKVIECEADYKPTLWKDDWNEGCNAEVMWSKYYQINAQGAFVLNRSSYQARIRSLSCDRCFMVLSIDLHLYNNSNQKARFYIDNLCVDGNTSEKSLYCVIDANSEGICDFKYCDSDFGEELILFSKRIDFSVRVQDDVSQCILAESDLISFPGFIETQNDNSAK